MFVLIVGDVCVVWVWCGINLIGHGMHRFVVDCFRSAYGLKVLICGVWCAYACLLQY